MLLTDAIVLAAGSSSRLGQPKQLVKHNGVGLLEGVISTIQSTDLVREILVVLGAHQETIQPMIKDARVRIVVNSDWQNGMGTSLKKGMASLTRTPMADKVLITVCDMPGVNKTLLQRLIIKHQRGRISASEYPDGRMGTPAVFCDSYIKMLSEIPAQEGARKFLQDHQQLTDCIPFDLGYWDIDTPEDLATLMP